GEPVEVVWASLDDEVGDVAAQRRLQTRGVGAVQGSDSGNGCEISAEQLFCVLSGGFVWFPVGGQGVLQVERLCVDAPGGGHAAALPLTPRSPSATERPSHHNVAGGDERIRHHRTGSLGGVSGWGQFRAGGGISRVLRWFGFRGGLG